MTQKQDDSVVNSVEIATEDSVSSSTTPQPSPEPSTISEDTPPKGYEGTPRELWPDADGNPPVVTEKLLAKLRGRYFTVQHVLLKDCGHKLDMINEPANNCEGCWWAFFNSHSQLVETADQFFRNHGKNPMIAMRGVKFVRFFVRFMATVHHFLQEQKANGTTDQGQSITDSGDGTADAQAESGQATSEVTVADQG